jgi:hypothetical protein
MKKIILNGTLLLMSCVVALVIFEGLLRYFEPVPMRLKGNKIQLTTNQTLIFEPENSEHIRNSIRSLGILKTPLVLGEKNLRSLSLSICRL